MSNLVPPAFFISNSIPKSGSSLMFNYQRLLFSKIYDSDMLSSYECLSHVLDTDCSSGFVPPSKFGALEDFLMSGRSLRPIYPCVIKTHAPFSPKFARYLHSSSSVFSSLCVRSPDQILRSAIINHKLRPMNLSIFLILSLVR